MKLMLRRNIPKLGEIGDVVDVRAGYARNYLLPQGLAVRPTKANIKRIEVEKQHYLQEFAAQRSELQTRAAAIEGKEITISAQATAEGRLYGSIGPAQIVAALAEIGVCLEPENIVLDSPIRQLDKYDVRVRLTEDVTANISVCVVPTEDAAQEGGTEPSGADSDQQ